MPFYFDLGGIALIGGSGGIRTPVGLHPNGFQDRLVMTTSIRFRIMGRRFCPL